LTTQDGGKFKLILPKQPAAIHIGPRRRRVRLLRRVALISAGVCVVKVVVNRLGLELFSVNPLFSAMVASTVFLVSFLLSGVLTDYKESEKIPGQIATSLETLTFEIRAIVVYNSKAKVDAPIHAVVRLGWAIHAWLNERINTQEVFATHRLTHGQVVQAATFLSSSTLQGRLMGEMSLLLSLINRIEVIRETDFVPLVSWMADIGAFFLSAGLVFARADSLWESCFFLFVITFLLIFLLRLIDDIDNPFGYVDQASAEDVSLDVLNLALNRLQDALPELDAEGESALRGQVDLVG